MAKQIMYTKQYIKPEEALRIKLVNNIYKQKDLLKKAREIGETICKNSRNAIKHAKLAIDKGTQYLNNNNGNNNIYKLKCSFQNYDWGQYANNSLVAVALINHSLFNYILINYLRKNYIKNILKYIKMIIINLNYLLLFLISNYFLALLG